MLGYYENNEATNEVINEEGYLLTGDLGYIDNDGYLYIKGRMGLVHSDEQVIAVVYPNYEALKEDYSNQINSNDFIRSIVKKTMDAE